MRTGKAYLGPSVLYQGKFYSLPFISVILHHQVSSWFCNLLKYSTCTSIHGFDSCRKCYRAQCFVKRTLCRCERSDQIVCWLVLIRWCWTADRQWVVLRYAYSAFNSNEIYGGDWITSLLCRNKPIPQTETNWPILFGLAGELEWILYSIEVLLFL